MMVNRTTAFARATSAAGSNASIIERFRRFAYINCGVVPNRQGPERMRRATAIPVLLLVVGVGRSGSAQVLQLPVWSQFSIGPSVLVPDQGAAYLGGIRRSRYASVSRGNPLGKLPFLGRLQRDRASGHDVSLSRGQVTASIIDHQALDAAVLAEAARRRGVTNGTSRRAVALAERLPSRRASVTPSRRYRASRAAPRRQPRRSPAQSPAGDDFAQVLARAEKAGAEGKTGVARILYRMARKRTDSGALQRVIDAQLSQLK